VEWSVFWLALSFGIHIAMVNLGIFLSVFVPYLKWRADREGDAGLERVAYKLMRFYAATYAVAGVFGTAYTVFLLSFYPDFIGLAGHLTLFPFGISILMIAVHFMAITGFYYGWGRWSKSVHYAFGVALALSSLLIPLGFRAVFAFLNIPVGLRVKTDGTLYLDPSEALSNPTLAPLYIKSISAALTAGALAVIGGLAYSQARGGDSAASKAIRAAAPIAALGLAATSLAGLWYALSLRAVPYKFNNIFAGLGFSVGGAGAAHDLSWLFLLKMGLVAFQAYVVAVSYRELRAGRVPPGRHGLLLAAGLAGLATIVAGEYLNAFSQYPYFIACLGSPEACEPLKNLPPEALERLAPALDLRVYNQLATVPVVTAMTVTFMAALLAATAYFFYTIIYRPGGR